MTFYKVRYLRPTGRFHTIWRAVHGMPMNPNAEDEDLMDICADLAQLLNPTQRARRHHQVLSLRLASNLVAGAAARHSHLTDELLQDTANFLDEIRTSNNVDNDTEDDQMSIDDNSKGSEINYQVRSPSYPVTSTADILHVSETEDFCEIYNDEQDKSMSTENAEEHEDDCDNNNVEFDDGSDHVEQDLNNIENNNEALLAYPVTSTADILHVSEAEDLCEIYNDEQDKSMSTENAEEHEDDFDNNNVEFNDGNDDGEPFINNIDNNNEPLVNKSISTDEVNPSTKQEHAAESSKAENTVSSSARQMVSQSTNTDPFDLMLTAENAPVHDNILKSNTHGNDESIQISENLLTDTNRFDNATVPFMVTAEDFTKGQDEIRTQEEFNINLSPTVLATHSPVSTGNEQSSPIIHLSSDKTPRYEDRTYNVNQHTSGNKLNSLNTLNTFCKTDAISSTIISETHNSPILESNVPDSENIPSFIITLNRRRSLAFTDQDNQEPTIKRIRIARDNLSGIEEVQEFPLDLTTKCRHFDRFNSELCPHRRAELIMPERPLDLRSPIRVEMNNEELRIPNIVHVENRTSPNTHTITADPRNEDSNMDVDTPALNTDSWITMTDTTAAALSTLSEPAEISAHTHQASLPPGTRGVVTAPATRRRRVRKRRVTVYRARKNPLEVVKIVRSQMTGRHSLRSSLVLQGNQNSTNTMEDEEMRGNNLTQLDTSATEAVQPQALIHQDTAISPPNIELPVISYGKQLDDENLFRPTSSELTKQIFEESPIRDSILSFEIAESASELSPQLTHERQTTLSNQYEGRIASTSSSPQTEPQNIIVYVEIHQPPNESISVTSPTSEPVLNLTAEQNEAASLRRSSVSRSTDSSNFTEADSTTTDEEVQQKTSLLEIHEESEQVEEEESPPIQEPELRRFPRSRPLETVLEESEPRYSEETTLDKEINEEITTVELGEDNVRKEAECFQEIQGLQDHEDIISNEHHSQRQNSSISDGEEEVSSLNEIIDDVQIYGELDISIKDNEPIQNDVETTCSEDGLSTVSSLGLDGYTIIYKRDDPSRAIMMRSRISDNPELKKYIYRRWMSQFT